MKAIHASLRQIGNSQGFVIPKPILAQLALNPEEGAELTIEGGALVAQASQPSAHRLGGGGQKDRRGRR